MMIDHNWRLRAACVGCDPATFFPDTIGKGPGRLASKLKAEALALCAGCEVTVECLTFALARSEYQDFGIWGGVTASRRRELRRGRGDRRALLPSGI